MTQRPGADASRVRAALPARGPADLGLAGRLDASVGTSPATRRRPRRTRPGRASRATRATQRAPSLRPATGSPPGRNGAGNGAAGPRLRAPSSSATPALTRTRAHITHTRASQTYTRTPRPTYTCEHTDVPQAVTQRRANIKTPPPHKQLQTDEHSRNTEGSHKDTRTLKFPYTDGQTHTRKDPQTHTHAQTKGHVHGKNTLTHQNANTHTGTNS